MRHAIALAVSLALAAPACGAAPPPTCLDAAEAAERHWGVPAGLIGAIGRVESGRADPATGQVAPWPFAVNADGAGASFASEPEAVQFVQAQQARGARLIDVGCFQIDLFYHPDAFASLDQAFDPTINAEYAGAFLSALHDRLQDWPAAVAAYHSAEPNAGEAYRRQVMAALGAGGPGGAASGRPGLHSSPPIPHLVPGGDPYVVLMSAAARSVRVIEPTAAPARFAGK